MKIPHAVVGTIVALLLANAGMGLAAPTQGGSSDAATTRTVSSAPAPATSAVASRDAATTGALSASATSSALDARLKQIRAIRDRGAPPPTAATVSTSTTLAASTQATSGTLATGSTGAVRRSAVATATPKPAITVSRGQKTPPPSLTKVSEAGKASPTPTPAPPPATHPPVEEWPWGEPFEVVGQRGVILRGMYKPPYRKTGEVVIFITGKTKTYAEAWKPLVGRLASRGFGIVVFDTRGLGFSKRTQSGTEIEFPNNEGGHKDVVKDIGKVLAFLKKEKGLQGVKTIGIGESVGANALIMAAAENPGTIRSAITLSAGPDYGGLMPLESLKDFGGHPILAIAAGGDNYSAPFLKDIQAQAKDVSTIPAPGKFHGADLLQDPTLIPRIVEWAEKN